MNWKKHVRTGLNLFMGTMAGVFLGSSLYTCWERAARPGRGCGERPGWGEREPAAVPCGEGKGRERAAWALPAAPRPQRSAPASLRGGV